MDHIFELKGSWKGGLSGVGKISTNHLTTDVSIPASMGGSEVGTNPDELLLSSSAACYFMTIGLYLERNKVQFEDISISSKLIVSEKGRLHVESIHHYPVIYLTEEPDAALSEQIHKIAHQAEEGCMITRAIKGNVKVIVEPSVKQV
ncbi:OsmC family protein [Guptibacillus hwajinpoensis]|uniref:Peroxiredoxin-like protein n=1 Tax=Guptibacillus hwajinpoensis TaxID=208199 RepID=A0ABU0K119_9BACL|nr:OsmC family protein [Alkalihalobacillus hemicentroti]MDQ0483034.1 peroxiredoxin-like protein [Alkalihalobacillus hemicentroti]